MLRNTASVSVSQKALNGRSVVFGLPVRLEDIRLEDHRERMRVGAVEIGETNHRHVQLKGIYSGPELEVASPCLSNWLISSISGEATTGVFVDFLRNRARSKFSPLRRWISSG